MDSSIATLIRRLTFSLLLLQSLFPFSISSSNQRHLLQSQSPQNLQTFPSTAIPAFTNSPPVSPLSPPPSPISAPSDSDNANIAAAVIGTAASSFALYGFLFFAFYRFTRKKRRVHNSNGDSNLFRSKPEPTIKTVPQRRCDRCNGFPDDENPPEPLRRRRLKGDLMAQESPLLPSDSINSSSPVFAQSRASNRISSASIESDSAAAKSHPSPAPVPPPPPAPPRPPNPPPLRRTLPAAASPVRSEGGTERPRMKPLHWEKVTPMRMGHSMVWDRINDGSIKFDDDQMEALFGYIASNPNPTKSNSSESPFPISISTTIPTQITLLNPHKSQNIAIILRTLTVPLNPKILASLRSGRDLPADDLDKLSRITLTNEEQSLILSFSGDPLRLADAESFLFHLLKTFPSAFPRIQSMHFRFCVYKSEILLLNQSLSDLELACKELRNNGLFLKLLEAILKAGNRMNAGTARGNAKAFDLTALRKLSDIKSSDGKTTLLHFVVEEVVRSEGEQCAAAIDGESVSEDREREFLMLGLPVVCGLGSEFMNVRKAASMDFDAMGIACSALDDRVRDIGQFLRSCEEENEEGFVREMRGFVEVVTKEIEEVREEQWRIMEIVKRTTEYYQLGDASMKKEGKPSLMIFVIVRDFLAMVDQACVDISKNVLKKRMKEKRIDARFPNLPARFIADNSVYCSDSEEEISVQGT